ncbi:MAG: hypothetical protein HY721_03585 [Planctomycetes bacterium]|nr:hypothetical protein [Planctomycetota bacterium]
MPPWKRRLTIALGIAALSASLAAGALLAVRTARQAALERSAREAEEWFAGPRYNTKGAPARSRLAWEALAEAGEASFPLIQRLLCHGDPVVVARVARAIDIDFSQKGRDAASKADVRSPYRRTLPDVVRHLAWSGRPEALERIVRAVFESPDAFLSAELERAVEGLPRLRPGLLARAVLFANTEAEICQKRLAAWWRENSSRLVWNAELRKFVVR